MLSVLGWFVPAVIAIWALFGIFFVVAKLASVDLASPFKRVDYGKREIERRKALGYEK